jgi:cell division protein FtsW
MTAQALRHHSYTQAKPGESGRKQKFDNVLVISVVSLLSLGLVMVASASIAIADRKTQVPLYFFYRQAAYIGAGLLLSAIVLKIPLRLWEKSGAVLFIFGLLTLAIILLPGIGHTVNGSTRWMNLGLFKAQPSEFMKLFAIVYLAGYLIRRNEEIRTSVWGFMKPMSLLLLTALLLLLEPDFGTTVVIFATAMGMMYLAGVRLLHFGVLILLCGLAMAALVLGSPYRLERLTAFMNPWADPFNSGFQLTQALIAFGRGEWFGVGLGSGIQKLFYLPEAHTDFVFAVIAEELGMVGAMTVLLLFACVIWRAFLIARRAERLDKPFAAYIAYGIGLWIGIQSFINLGVNMGVLPTKGLTLPLMSYGGSSIIAMCMAIALLLRVDIELRGWPADSQRKGSQRDFKPGKRRRAA